MAVYDAVDSVFGPIIKTISHTRKRKKERMVDALALGGDEGRGKLR